MKKKCQSTRLFPNSLLKALTKLHSYLKNCHNYNVLPEKRKPEFGIAADTCIKVNKQLTITHQGIRGLKN